MGWKCSWNAPGVEAFFLPVIPLFWGPSERQPAPQAAATGPFLPCSGTKRHVKPDLLCVQSCRAGLTSSCHWAVTGHGRQLHGWAAVMGRDALSPAIITDKYIFLKPWESCTFQWWGHQRQEIESVTEAAIWTGIVLSDTVTPPTQYTNTFMETCFPNLKNCTINFNYQKKPEVIKYKIKITCYCVTKGQLNFDILLSKSFILYSLLRLDGWFYKIKIVSFL